MLGCCDTQNNISADIMIRQLDAKYVKGKVEVEIETRMTTNCTTIKKGDILYI